jgi:hypothetical protein
MEPSLDGKLVLRKFKESEQEEEEKNEGKVVKPKFAAKK